MLINKMFCKFIFNFCKVISFLVKTLKYVFTLFYSLLFFIDLKIGPIIILLLCKMFILINYLKNYAFLISRGNRILSFILAKHTDVNYCNTT